MKQQAWEQPGDETGLVGAHIRKASGPVRYGTDQAPLERHFEEDRTMAERSRIFDDFAGVAGGAFSAIAGIGEELGALVRSRVDEALSALQLVRREEFEAVSELAAAARDGQEAATARLAALEARLAVLEGHASLADPQGGSGEHDPHAAQGAPGGPPPRSGSDDGSSDVPSAGF
ncbi:MAG: accessory factor UbiK family protein [Janthinobacterium lividum]